MPVLRLVLLALLFVGSAHAQQWSEFAYISQTLGVNANRLCLGEESRGELGCPAYAPYVDAATGYMGFGTTSPTYGLTISGTYAGIFLEEANGGPNNEVFLVHYGNLFQIQNRDSMQNGGAYRTSVFTVDVRADPYSFSMGQTGNVGINMRTPAASKYPSTTLHVSGSLRVSHETSTTLQTCDANRTGAIKYQSGDFYYCRNGSSWESLTSLSGGGGSVISGTTSMVSGWPDAIVCNVTGAASGKMAFYPYYTPYSDGRFYYQNIYDGGLRVYVIFQSDGTYSNFSSATGNITGTSNCAKSIVQLYTDGQAFNFIGNSGAGGGALGDRLTSGTLAVTTNSTTSVISLTTTGTTWGYLGANGTYLPNIATNAIQVISATTPLTCDATRSGTLRYNSPTTALELCTGTSWQVMGVGIPAGTISAFASTTCPTGWSEYTPARGRFLRGIDNGAGNDPDGTRGPGTAQADALQVHTHQFDYANQTTFSGTYTGRIDGTTNTAGSPARGAIGNQGITDARTSTETRPKNVAVTFCQFNGTSNGWNNPLSGGSTTAAGATGHIQYNTSNGFDANAGLTWDNANQRLNAAKVSTSLVDATVVKLADNPPNPCDGAAVGSLKTIGGKIYVCRQ